MPPEYFRPPPPPPTWIPSSGFTPARPPAPPPAGPIGASGVLAWIVILLCLAVVITFNQISARRRDSASPTDFTPNVSLEITARYAVGLGALNAANPNHTSASNPAAMLVPQMDLTAKSIPDHFRVAMVAGEILGKSAALQRLNNVAPMLKGDADLSTDLQSLQTIYNQGPDALSSDARSRLIGRYPWYAKLALGSAGAPNNPDRIAAESAAEQTTICLFIALGVVLFAFLTGLVLMVAGIVRLVDGKFVCRYQRMNGDSTPFLEAFAIYLLLYAVVPMALLRNSAGRLGSGPILFVVAGILPVVLAIFWPRIRGVSSEQWRLGLGWHRGTGVLWEMFLGIVGYLAGLPLLAVGALITIALVRISGANTAHPIVNQANGLASALRLLLLAAVFAPIAEETLFRGALLCHLRRRHRWLIAGPLVSLIFAALHPQGWAAIPALGAIGLTLAGIREWRGTIIASATAHALNNAFVMLLLIVATN